MRTATTAAVVSRATGISRSHAQRPLAMRLVGIAIAALLPAVFWSAVIEVVSRALGTPLSPLAITTIGAAIALFLFAVCTPLMLRTSDADHKLNIRRSSR
ncbi:MAG: hypothetical protein ABW006_13910 [Hyphomicrobium sp.]